MTNKIKELAFKNQGQSTTEYILVTLLGATLVLILSVQFSPPLQKKLAQLEDIVAAKIAGGELLTHPGEGGRIDIAVEGGGGSTSSETASSRPGTKQGAGSAGSGGQGGGAGSMSGVRGSTDFLKGGTPQDGSTGGGSSGGADEKNQQRSGGSATSRGQSKASETTDKESKKSESEEGGQSSAEEKSQGLVYGEGEVEVATSTSGLGWLRIILMLLIVLLSLFIGFEVYKGIQSRRQK